MKKQTWQYSRLGKTYEFSAAHHLVKVPDGHPCKRVHGHNYVVEIEVRGDIAAINDFCNGIDFHDLDKVVKPIIAQIDHQSLNDFIENPTAERLAQWLLRQILDNSSKYVYSVKVWETPKCWAMVVNEGGLYHSVHRE